MDVKGRVFQDPPGVRQWLSQHGPRELATLGCLLVHVLVGKRRGLHLFVPEGRPFREYAERHILSCHLLEPHLR